MEFLKVTGFKGLLCAVKYSLGFVCLFVEIRNHVVHAGLAIDMQLKMTLNF